MFLKSDMISFVFVHVVLLERRMLIEEIKLVIFVLQIVKNQVKKKSYIDLLSRRNQSHRPEYHKNFDVHLEH